MGFYKSHLYRKSRILRGIVFGRCIAILFMMFVFTGGWNYSSYYKASNYLTHKSTVSAPSSKMPAVAKPKNGYSRNFTSSKRMASFQVKVPNEGSYYYILLRSLTTNKAVVSLFIYPGKMVKIKVPLGKYKMYYATGKKWYGEKNLFGTETVYAKAEQVLDFHIEGRYVMGHSVELIKRQGGNLSTSQADPKDFGN